MTKISFNLETKNEKELLWIYKYLNKIMSYTVTNTIIINMAIHVLYLELQKNIEEK